MFQKTIVALLLTGAVASAQADVVLQENFNNVPGLTSTGWVLNNASTPAGITPGWYQGDQTQFAAQNGTAESYAAANYNNAAAGGTLDNWIITPEFSTANSGTVSFWLRAGDDPAYSDQVAFGFSNGSSTLGSFSLEPAFTVLTDGWNLYNVKFAAQGLGATGRFAIQYTGLADASNYVGLDNLTVTVPEPSTMLVLATGLMGLAAARRRRRG